MTSVRGLTDLHKKTGAFSAKVRVGEFSNKLLYSEIQMFLFASEHIGEKKAAMSAAF